MRSKTPSLFPELNKAKKPTLTLEKRFGEDGYKRIAGVDEAGRGPLAGPVVAAAVVLPQRVGTRSPLHKIRDSKALRPQERYKVYDTIIERAQAVAWDFCDNLEIDDVNILEASLEAMRRAVMNLDPPPDLCLVDGNQPVPCLTPSFTVVKGDRLCMSIAAASVVAKTIRDHIMDGWHRLYPGYGFNLHKGYATREHKSAVEQIGPCPVHRKSFIKQKPRLPGPWK